MVVLCSLIRGTWSCSVHWLEVHGCALFTDIRGTWLFSVHWLDAYGCDLFTDQPASITRKRPPALKPRKDNDAYHLLDRPGQVVLARLRSGHNRLNVHMHRKLKIVPSQTCPCGEEDQTTEHVLQICNIHQPERIAQWPSATLLHQKLYGGLEDLKKTTNFITAAGLVV